MTNQIQINMGLILKICVSWSEDVPLIANIGVHESILLILATVISGIQTTTKVTTELRDTDGINGLKKTRKVYFQWNSTQSGYWKKNERNFGRILCNKSETCWLK